MRTPVWLTVVRGPQAEPVITRVVRALGAHTDLPLDRVEDATLVSAELLTLAFDEHERVAVRILRRDRGLEIAVADVDGTLTRGAQAGGGTEWGIIRAMADIATPDDDGWVVVRIGDAGSDGG